MGNQRPPSADSGLQEKLTELQKKNVEFDSFSREAVRIINDLNDKQIALQYDFQKQVDELNSKLESCDRRHEEDCVTIQLLTTEKKDLEKQVLQLEKKLALASKWNKMTQKLKSGSGLSKIILEEENGREP